MKKWQVIAIVVVLAFLVPATGFAVSQNQLNPITLASDMAQGEGAVPTAQETPVVSDQGQDAESAANGCPGWVDSDGDGVCDNCLAPNCAGNGNGNGNGAGGGPGWVDEDGDGVCDNYGTGGQGNGAGNGQGAAGCPGWVDSDGDGVCDNYGTGGQGNGVGNGQGNHRGGRW